MLYLVLCDRSAGSELDVSIWKDMHDLVFGRREVPGNRFVCPTFFNSTESLRSDTLTLIHWVT